MKEIISPLIKPLIEYFDGALMRDENTNQFYLYDSELQDRASCCTIGQVACLYVLDEVYHGNRRKPLIQDLINQISTQQLPNGAFSQPYFVEHGKPGTVDIAEIGAVSNALYHLYKYTEVEEVKQVLIKASDYLLTQVAKENPGAVYKNTVATNHDVLNGDVYAAHTWGRAYELTGDQKYLDQSLEVMRHVTKRFGVHSKGWWPYIEEWDGKVGMGNSVGYQGTIIAFAHTLIPLMSDSLREDWKNVSIEALEVMERELGIGPNEENEVPWWSRDWDNTWEIYLAFWRNKDNENLKRITMEKLSETQSELKLQGIEVFKPKIESRDASRSPVTTTFRKVATFAGIVTYMSLDEVRGS